jgi:iron-sulfur cluster assembly accessory protein
VIERDGVAVLVDPISWDFVTGSTVDYSTEMMRSAFVVATNPNAASKCSCGSSFDAKKNTGAKKS